MYALGDAWLAMEMGFEVFEVLHVQRTEARDRTVRALPPLLVHFVAIAADVSHDLRGHRETRARVCDVPKRGCTREARNARART